MIAPTQTRMSSNWERQYTHSIPTWLVSLSHCLCCALIGRYMVEPFIHSQNAHFQFCFCPVASLSWIQHYKKSCEYFTYFTVHYSIHYLFTLISAKSYNKQSKVEHFFEAIYTRKELHYIPECTISENCKSAIKSCDYIKVFFCSKQLTKTSKQVIEATLANMTADLGISCDIVFDNEERSYQSGQVVSAQVNLTFSRPTNCRCKWFQEWTRG